MYYYYYNSKYLYLSIYIYFLKNCLSVEEKPRHIKKKNAYTAYEVIILHDLSFPYTQTHTCLTRPFDLQRIMTLLINDTFSHGIDTIHHIVEWKTLLRGYFYWKACSDRNEYFPVFYLVDQRNYEKEYLEYDRCLCTFHLHFKSPSSFIFSTLRMSIVESILSRLTKMHISITSLWLL